MKRIVLLLAFIVLAAAMAPATLAQLRKAERALRDKNFQEAHSFVQEVLDEKPDDHRALELLARIHEAEAQESEGEAFLVHWKAMVDTYRNMVEVRPKSQAEVTNKLLLAYQASFMSGVEAFNAAGAELDQELSGAHYRESSLHFEAAALVMPDSLDPFLNWAFAAMSGGSDVDAIEPLQRAIAIGPVESDWYSYLGRIYLSNDSAAVAVEVLEEGVTVFEDSEELQALLLNAYASTGQNDRAIERYLDRAETHPDDRITRYNLGSLLLQAERYDEAIVHLGAAVAIDDQHTDSHYNLGAAYINKATEVQEQAVALDEALRAERDTLSQEEIDARQAAIFALDDEKKALMSRAIPYLERAKMLAETAEADNTSICRALYQAYGQTNAMDMVETVKECSGF